MLLFHPGDLGISGLLMLLGLLVLLVGLPIFFVVLIIYKVATRNRDEFQTGIAKKD